MKTIGIVGGLAWPSTVIYYRTINELVAGGWTACTVPVIDTTIAHAQAAVEMALAGEPAQPST